MTRVSIPSGIQHALHLGDQHVVVAEVGASIRSYAVAGRDVVLPYPVTSMAPAFSGCVLAPWPNRLRDGAYEWDGERYQVPINEPQRWTALHGLVSHERFLRVGADDPADGVCDHPAARPGDGAARGPADDATTLTLEHALVPTPGYPWPLRLRVTFTLSDGGLQVTTTATTDGSTVAPYGLGFHPWLSPGSGSVDACTLRVDARTHVLVDDRLLPTGTIPLGRAEDMHAGRPLAGVALDDAYVDVDRDGDGLSWAGLTGADGRTAAMWMDAAFTAWQVCTGDQVPAIARRGVAIEPMTCVADAYRTGDRLIRLEPGVPHVARWGLTLR